MSFVRWDEDGRRPVAAIFNMAPVVREGFTLGLPRAGRWTEALNSDADVYGGSGVGNGGVVVAREEGAHGQPASAVLTLPPLAALYLVPEGA